MMALAIDPTKMFAAMGFAADPWQRQVLTSRANRIMLNCCRQAGKSRVSSALAIHQAIFHPNSLILLLAPSQRQSFELFRKVMEFYNAIGRPVTAKYDTLSTLELTNGSRIICLPGEESSIRCYGNVSLLIVDEAARVADDLYRSIRPMLAISQGRLVALSTPWGRRGWFYREWTDSDSWEKIKAPWTLCPRITPAFIEEERKALGDSWVQQEYECLFTALHGLVYPEFETCFTDFYTPESAGKQLGGIDFGWRNPFAAIWGVLDRDGVLHIQNERYKRETSIQEHATHLPKNVFWYADPAGRSETESLRLAGFTIRRGNNEIRLGISAVSARIRTKTLTVNPTRCPELVEEAKAYRYPSEQERTALGENPIDCDNHALGALRYLISRLDARFIAKLRRSTPTEPNTPHEEPARPIKPPPQTHVESSPTTDEHLWTNL